MRRLSGILLLALLMAACQPDPALTIGGGIASEETQQAALPTLFALPTATPVIVPTTVPSEAVEAPLRIQIATGEGEMLVQTPTLAPSKTPTTTPTRTIAPTVSQTPTTTVTPTTTPTSQQFTFTGDGQSNNADATAVAMGVLSSQNPFIDPPLPQPVPQRPEAMNAPAANCSTNPWFFGEAGPPVCPVEEPQRGHGTYQRFEYGFMVWLEFNDKVYVLYDTPEQPRWQNYDDPYIEGAPERPENWPEVQRLGTFQPRRGFGEVWRQFEYVRARVGWALHEWETIYTPRWQRGEDGSILIEDPIGGVFYLYARGEWWEQYPNTPTIPGG